MPSSRMITLDLPTLRDTEELACDIALCAKPDWLIGLEGDLGTGKTAFARAFIRKRMGNPHEEIPSPSFSIVQTYEHVCKEGNLTILHGDLYRLLDAGELREVGLEAENAHTLRIVEWPEKGAGYLPEPDLILRFTIPESDNSDSRRRVEICGRPDTMRIVDRSLLIRKFLSQNWQSGVGRAVLTGDASARSYETVSLGNKTRILMNAPRQPDGPPIRDGKPYSVIAHLAEDIERFAAIDRFLDAKGLKVPEIFASDFEAGLMLLEDMGGEGIIDSVGKPMPERYFAAAEMLSFLHATTAPSKDGTVGETDLNLAPYDRGAMMIEAELLLDWYAPRFKGSKLKESERTSFFAIWSDLIGQLQQSQQHVVLRDFHSPNILWQSHERGIRRVGLIDFQDAVHGPTAYDLASLAQDARIDIPPDLERKIVDHYIEAQREQGNFDAVSFERAYAISAALRTTKILGIFVRLDERDNKPGYLRHLPRIIDYMKRSFEHSALSDYRNWYKDVIGL